MLVPQKNKNKLNILLLEYHVINPDLFSLDPQGPKADGTHKKGTFFLFIRDYTSLLIHAIQAISHLRNSSMI